MKYIAKVGTDDMYVKLVDKSIKDLLVQIENEIEQHSNMKILEVKDLKGNIIDIEKYLYRKQNAELRNKDNIEDIYRKVQQKLWRIYSKKMGNKEMYKLIKIELKKIRNSTSDLYEFKENVDKYLKTLEMQDI